MGLVILKLASIKLLEKRVYFLVGCVSFQLFFSSLARRGLEFQENFHFATPGDVEVCVPRVPISVRIWPLKHRL